VTPRARASQPQTAKACAQIAPTDVTSTPPPVARTHLSVREFGRQIGVSNRTIWTWIAAGRLEVVRLTPRTTRIAVAEVERFLAAKAR
jgi:excisionase family DNA binding protein